MGKTEVAKTFSSLGIPVFDADAEVHRIYENGIAAAALKDVCPAAITGDHIDRQILAGLIAADQGLMKKVTAKIHPLVQEAEQKFRAKQTGDFAVIDSPLILETGRARDMDLLVVVSATPENQRIRALARPGMTLEKFEMITSRQMPDEDKRKWADYVIENNGTKAELVQTVKDLIAHIQDNAVDHA